MSGSPKAARPVSRVLSKSSWVSDRDVPACQGPECDVVFSTVKRRHHCRFCGRIFCDRCSRFRVAKERCCLRCFGNMCEETNCPSGPFEAAFTDPNVSFGASGVTTIVSQDCGGAGSNEVELTVSRGDRVRLRHLVDENWVVATHVETSQSGLVPAAFLVRTRALDQLLERCAALGEPVPSIDKAAGAGAGPAQGVVATMTVCDNKPSHELELALPRGTEVTPRRWVNRRWVVVSTADGAAGLLPAAILVPDPATALPYVDPIDGALG